MDRATLILGVGLICSALLLNAWGSIAFWLCLVAGVIVITVSEIEELETIKENWEYWVIATTGVAVFTSAIALQRVLQYSSVFAMVICGGLLAYFAGKQFIANLF